MEAPMFRFVLDRFIDESGEVFLVMLAGLVCTAFTFEVVRPILGA
jgi:hypothetical protein